MSDTWDIRNTDTCLRDGSHHKRHQFTAQECHDIVEALDASGVPVIEVTHGDGLGGSSFNYGFSKTPRAGADQAGGRDRRGRQDRVPDAARCTKEDIKEAQGNGGSICRIATHCTEADVSTQHFGLARRAVRTSPRHNCCTGRASASSSAARRTS